MYIPTYTYFQNAFQTLLCLGDEILLYQRIYIVIGCASVPVPCEFKTSGKERVHLTLWLHISC